VTRNSLLPWFMLLVSVGFFAPPLDAQAKTNKLVLSLGGQLSAGEGNNKILPGIIIDPVDNMNPDGLPTQTLSGSGSSASVAVKVVNPGNSGSPQHYQIVQTVGTNTGNITASIVNFTAFSSIKTAISVQSVLSVTYPSDETSLLNINLINTGVTIQFSDGTTLFECTATPPFPTPPCIVVTPGGFTVTWSKQSPAATNVGGSLILNLADANYDATLTTDIELPGDLVTLSNTTLAQQNGIWVNGVANGNQWDHQTFSPQNSVMVPTPGNPDSVTIPMGGNVTHSDEDNGNEIVAFATDRPVALVENVAWTKNFDNIPVQFLFNGPIRLPVTFWIVKGPFEDQARRAKLQISTAVQIYKNERMGIKPYLPLGDASIHDATGNPQASNFYDFRCKFTDASPSVDPMKLALETAIGRAPNTINIYVVNTIGGGVANGATCGFGDDVSVLSAIAPYDNLAHELGHDMALQHTELCSLNKAEAPKEYFPPNFDESNLMTSGLCRTGDYLTEGQIFRANVTDFSAINFFNILRPGEPTRICETRTELNQTSLGGAAVSHESLGCPAIYKRIWADGSFQPN
jgi:hypothetical protein